ncbi:uncharacterized protein MEPE_04019 [Melanopsichium pennsylvanicum]|uniref:Uncharacterized protein n=1 Tax=Melanopsichium pennsylvanicum TaxID=63383 RepID=A0AAJ4XMI4_9BASI|nr:uncharacterized protein MEPE_04019 [Melanopsichium pennsylvanicum]
MEISFFAVSFTAWKLWKKTKLVPVKAMDLYTDTVQSKKDIRRRRRRRRRRDLSRQGTGEKLPVLLEDEEEPEEEEQEKAEGQRKEPGDKRADMAFASRALQYLGF